VSSVPDSHSAAVAAPSARRRRGRLGLVLIALVCAAPVIAAFIVYFFVRPEARNNYGSLIEPQRPIPAALSLTTLDGRPFDLASLHGKWTMVMAGPAACDAACASQLYLMRQVRISTGRDQERIERVWLITDAEPVATMLIREYDGTHFLRASPAALQPFLPADAAAGTGLSDHIWVIDPLGHLMMRFPKNPDPKRLRKDVSKLAYNSRGWVMK
jgi:hypothetical protein